MKTPQMWQGFRMHWNPFVDEPESPKQPFDEDAYLELASFVEFEDADLQAW